MEFIREYVMMLLTAAVVCSLITLIAPERKTPNGINKYIRWVAALVLLLVMASPVKDAVAALTSYSMDGYADNSERTWSDASSDTVISTTIGLLEEHVKSALESKFGITDAAVMIEADDSDIADIRLTLVSVTLGDPADTRKSGDAGRYISAMLECETVISDGEGSECYGHVD